MEIKEGMYVRTTLGISKLINIHKSTTRDIYEFDKLDEELWSGDVWSWVFDCEIEMIVIKASFNKIDLIEVGDYVNGYKVTCVYPNLIKVDSSDIWEIHPNEIKSIVTKEQFKEREYIFGD